jgi:hypothetical protein
MSKKNKQWRKAKASEAYVNYYINNPQLFIDNDSKFDKVCIESDIYNLRKEAKTDENRRELNVLEAEYKEMFGKNLE